MVKRLASLFILISFVFGLSNEVRSVSFDHDETVSIKADSYLSASSIVSDDCEDCHDDGCHDHDKHCAHHCSGLHNFIEAKQKIKLDNKADVDSKITWCFNFHYDEPFLDPALKPPLFS
tara:strand:+ start:515 stop:871 length:357 start_codon:yes stop_codon:yes gene_type:complete